MANGCKSTTWMEERVSTTRISEANQLLSLWHSSKCEGSPTGEVHEIDIPSRVTPNVWRRTNKCFNGTIL